MPPFLPHSALISAVEFIYVMGTTEFVPSRSSRSSQASSTSPVGAMSAIEQPAVMLGRMTRWRGAQRMRAVSAMKWTPQKMMYSASVWLAAC